MITGATLYNYFTDKVDSSFTGYLSPAQANRLFRNTIFVSCDKKYLSLDDQKTFDELSSLISTEQVFSVTNNQIYTAPIQIATIAFNSPALGVATITTALPHNLTASELVTISNITGVVPSLNITITATRVSATAFTIPFVLVSGTYSAGQGQITYAEMISDYLHLYGVKTKFEEPLYVAVNASSGTSPIQVYFKVRNKIRTGDQITISGATHNTAINGAWYVKQIGNVGYQLYVDADFQSPSTGGVRYLFPEGAVTKTYYEFCKPNLSDRKIDPFNEASVELPKYESANKMLKFYPLNRVCSEIMIDYFALPPVEIDVNDNFLDLELFYPAKYLFWMVDVAAKLYSTPTRDVLLNQEVTQELILNP